MSTRKLADRRQRRTRRALFWALAAGLLAYGLFAGDHRPHHLALLWLEERRTEERIEELAAEREELEERLASVEGDPLALEALAREKGMVRPGDLVYRIVPVSPDVRREAAESLAVQAARAPEEPAETEASPGSSAAGPTPRPGAPAGGDRPAAGVDPERAPPAAGAARPPESDATDPRWRWLDEPSPAGPAGGPAADSLPGG